MRNRSRPRAKRRSECVYSGRMLNWSSDEIFRWLSNKDKRRVREQGLVPNLREHDWKPPRG